MVKEEDNKEVRRRAKPDEERNHEAVFSAGAKGKVECVGKAEEKEGEFPVVLGREAESVSEREETTVREICKGRGEGENGAMRMEENGERSGLATTERRRKRGKEENSSAERKEKAYSGKKVVRLERWGGNKVEWREAKKEEKVEKATIIEVTRASNGDTR